MPGWAARSGAEARFAAEIAHYTAALRHGPGLGVVTDSDQGAGRPVLVLPGFGFGDAATLPMQGVLQAAGYRVIWSRIAINVRCSDRTVDALADVARRAVTDDGGRRLLVVGHSRGGMLARGLAARHPELVEHAVSLGAPLNHEFAFYEIPQPLVGALRTVHQRDPELRMRQCVTPDCTCPYMEATKRPMPAEVRLTSIYTMSDGVVDWRACVVPGANNIEVDGSHLGMGLRPRTLQVVLDTLAS